MWTEVHVGERPSLGRKCKQKRLHYFRQLSAGHFQLVVIRLSVWENNATAWKRLLVDK